MTTWILAPAPPVHLEEQGLHTLAVVRLFTCQRATSRNRLRALALPLPGDPDPRPEPRHGEANHSVASDPVNPALAKIFYHLQEARIDRSHPGTDRIRAVEVRLEARTATARVHPGQFNLKEVVAGATCGRRVTYAAVQAPRTTVEPDGRSSFRLIVRSTAPIGRREGIIASPPRHCQPGKLFSSAAGRRRSGHFSGRTLWCRLLACVTGRRAQARSESPGKMAGGGRQQGYDGGGRKFRVASGMGLLTSDFS